MGSDPKISSMNCRGSAEFGKKFRKWAPFKGVSVYKLLVVFVVIHEISTVIGFFSNFIQKHLEIMEIGVGSLNLGA